MSRTLRLLHWFAVGMQSAALCLFAWLWVLFGGDGWAFLMGWSIYHGALSSHALWSARKQKEGIQA